MEDVPGEVIEKKGNGTMTTLEISELLTPAEAARLLDVTPERVRQLAELGRLPSTRTRLGRLFARDDVMALRKARAASQEAKGQY